MEPKKIVIVGGVTMDLFYKINSLPKKSSSVEAREYFLSPGGKALNIATAVKYFDVEPFLISSVGKDKLSEEIFEVLSQEGIAQDGFIIQDSILTDLVTVLVSPDGTPTFIGTRGANYYLTTHDIKRLENEIKKCSAMIVTLEIPYETAKIALQIAKNNNITTIFNPSPADEFNLDILSLVDYFFLNENEAYICSFNKKSVKDQVQFFLNYGAKKIIITYEDKGYIIATKDKFVSKNAFRVKTVDSTGSGDTFGGVLIACLVEGKSEEKALRYASAGGALVAQRNGSGLVVPRRKEIENFLNNYGNN